MANFMFLFRFEKDWRPSSPEEMEQLMKRWMSWKDELEKSGHFVKAGERMDVNGKVVRGRERTVSDGPYVEVKDIVNGLLVVSAHDLDEAAELAKGCPILEGDGSVEVRPLLSM